MSERVREKPAEVRNDNFEFTEDIKEKNKLFIPDEINESEKKICINWDSLYDKTIAEQSLVLTFLCIIV